MISKTKPKTHNYVVVVVEVVMCTVQKEKSFTFFLLSSLCFLLWMDCVQHIKVVKWFLSLTLVFFFFYMLNF